MDKKITVNKIIDAPLKKVWHYYTDPGHIVKWNFADVSWHCPYAENDMRVGGIYKARMEAMDGSFGFDFEAVYNEIELNKRFSYAMTDGREVRVTFDERESSTLIIIDFDGDQENSLETQEKGWQAILNNFSSYAELN